MATSPETFSKVKNLLRKMDQSIDAARSRRLTDTKPLPVAHAALAPKAAPTTQPLAPRVDPIPLANQPLRAKPMMPRPDINSGFVTNL